MIELREISWCVPGGFSLRNVSLAVPSGAYAVLMGATGCGKTTLLEILCGLRRPQLGSVWLDGQDVTTWPPHERRVGYLPQDLALFPHRNVAFQIGFAPRLQGRPAVEIRELVEQLARDLGISHLLERFPENLSGGEKQRVALARALAANPRVLLLDEPLSALDEDTRAEATELLRQVQARHGLTVLHVTHSQAEARALGQVRLRLTKEGVTQEG